MPSLNPGSSLVLSSLTVNGISLINLNTAAAPAPVAGTALQIVQADGSPNRIEMDSFASSNVLTARRADTTNASKSAVQNGENIVSILSYGYGATGYSAAPRAVFSQFAAENWTDTAQGTAQNWQITQPTTTTTNIVLQLLYTGSSPGLAPFTNGVTDLGTNTLGFKRLYLDYTNSATTGNQTISKATGSFQIAAAGSTATITNTLCTANSIVQAFLMTVDGTAKTAVAVPAAGSFTVTLNVAATGQVKVGFLIINTD